MHNLDAVVEAIRSSFEATDSQREAALKQSRALIRHCAALIRSIHRRQWDSVDEQMTTVREAADALRASTAGYADLESAGYTQDALKEYAEAMLTYAFVRGHDELPTPESLGIEPSAYVNGLAEAASEMRRNILDLQRRDGSAEEVQRLLDIMDTVYAALFSFDFPDAVTAGLRRRVDQLRGVLERTRGDVTAAMRQDKLLAALRAFEERLGVAEE